MALDGMKIKKVAAGGWHSACISQYDDLYMFGWNESGQLAQPTNLAKPAECFRYEYGFWGFSQQKFILSPNIKLKII
jgi:alpha-tubulin suppressor-like RCC1 family protein